MLTISHIEKSYGEHTLFSDLSLFIGKNDRSALIGNNGTGKSTILKIIAGEIDADSGTVFLETGKKIGYLPQNAEFESDLDLLHSVICINHEITYNLTNLLKYKNTDIEYNNKIAQEYAEFNADFEHYGGYSLLERAKIILKMLGFTEKEFELNIKYLSGGQKTRALLGKILLSDCDILLLDEPTNHLDYKAQELFVNFLNNEYNGSVLAVSHDRYFLNQISKKIYCLENGRIEEYPGNYDNYVNIRKERELTEQNLAEKYKKDIAKMEESVQTLFSHRNFSARDSMVKKLERIKQIQAEYEKKYNPNIMKIKLEQSNQSGSTVLKFENMSKTYNNKTLFKNVSLTVEKGQKIGIVGPNGSGKSTFLRIINGTRDADSGLLTYGYNVNLSYFAQEFEEFDDNKTLFEELLYNTNLSSSETRNLLAKFSFTDNDIYKYVKNLSGGEKCRLALAKIMADKPNLLLLDEPTNHLDILSREILEDAIKSFEGTVITVSHDRYFLDHTCNLTIEIKDGCFTKYYGNYSYYKEKKNYSELISKISEPKKTEKKTELNNRQIREKIKPLSKKIKEIEYQINETEISIAELSELLGSEEIYKNGSAKEISEEYNKKQNLLNELMTQWEKTETEIDEYEKMIK